jgi:hypothetical protein
VAILIYGPAQVQATASGEPITAVTRLAAGEGGRARALRTVEVDGIQVAEIAPVLAIALKDLRSEGLIWVSVNHQ